MPLLQEIVSRNRRLPDFKRVGGYIIWEKDFRVQPDEGEAASAGGRNRKSGGAGSGGGAVSREECYLAIVNPAGGRRAKPQDAGPAWIGCERPGVAVEVAETQRANEATRIAARLYGRGFRKLLRWAGDGTAYEVVTACSRRPARARRPTLGFFAPGTGNSFLRDFSDRGVEHAMESLITKRTQACDIFCALHHRAASSLH